MSKKTHFQIACSKYFDAIHNADVGLGINHPNQFFEESQKILKGELKVQPKKENLVKKDIVDSIDAMDFDEPLE